MLFILALAVGLTAAPKTEPSIQQPSRRARGSDVLRIGTGPRHVYFAHRRHQDNFGGENSCGLCHHLHKPGDVGTPCSECHQALYTATDVFDHSAHIATQEGNASCITCHGEGEPRVLTGVKTCQDCHGKDMMAGNPVVTKFNSRWAGGYKDAMHKMCLACHLRKAADPQVARPDLARCGSCHNEGTKPEQRYRAAIQPQGIGDRTP